MADNMEREERGDMTVEKFKLWSSKALKSFLTVRKKSTKGSFDELVAKEVDFFSCDQAELNLKTPIGLGYIPHP